MVEIKALVPWLLENKIRLDVVYTQGDNSRIRWSASQECQHVLSSDIKPYLLQQEASWHLARAPSRGGFAGQLHAPQCVNACSGVMNPIKRQSEIAARR